jgi:LEA14-like dessication related protein
MKSFALAFLAGLLGACSALAPKLEAPHLSIGNVELLSGSVWEQRLRVHLRVENPNARALPVSSLVYTIEVAGQELAHGAANESFLVPANGASEFATDVTANVAGALVAILGRGGSSNQAVDYRITGKVTLSGGLVRSIPFEHSGTFKLQ